MKANNSIDDYIFKNKEAELKKQRLELKAIGYKLEKELKIERTIKNNNFLLNKEEQLNKNI